MANRVKQEYKPHIQDLAQDWKEKAENKKIKWDKKKEKSYNRWSQIQNYAYMAYLQVCRQVLGDSFKRKALRIFRHMSRLIPSRTHQQIKSHHQKMMKKYSSIDEILSNIKRYLSSYLHFTPEKRAQIGALEKHIKIFIAEQNSMKKFKQMDIAVAWPEDLKILDFEVKIEEQSQKILVEESEMNYIMYENGNVVKKEHSQSSESPQQQDKQEDSEQC